MMKPNISSWVLATVLLTTVTLAEAQPAKIPRIGYLAGSSSSTSTDRREAFRQGLRELGYVEGKNIVIEQRYAEGKFDRLPALAAELVRLKVDTIVTAGPQATRACQTSNFHDSHCDGAGPRSCWKRVRRQPRAA